MILPIKLFVRLVAIPASLAKVVLLIAHCVLVLTLDQLFPHVPVLTLIMMEVMQYVIVVTILVRLVAMG